MSRRLDPRVIPPIAAFVDLPSPRLLLSGMGCVAILGCSSTQAPSDDTGGTTQAGGVSNAGGQVGSGGDATASGGNSVGGSGGMTGDGTGGSPSAGGAGGSPSAGGAGGGPSGGAGSGSAGSGGTGGGGTGSGSAGSGSAGSGGAGSGGAGSEATPSEGCGKVPSLQSGSITLASGGTNRTYQLSVPDEYDVDHPYRLILGFHGATGSSGDVAPTYFGLRPLSEGSTIFIAPDAVDGFWSSDSDVTLMDDIVDQVQSSLCIDTNRIMLEGFSQGGAMAWTLACARPGMYRAAVVHSGGGLARPTSCEPIAFMSSLGQSESDGLGQTSNSDFFAMQNGCTVEPLPKAPSGRHTCSDYSGCSEGHPTRWCDYDGGHTPAPSDAGQGSSWMPQEVWTFLAQF